MRKRFGQRSPGDIKGSLDQDPNSVTARRTLCNAGERGRLRHNCFQVYVFDCSETLGRSVCSLRPQWLHQFGARAGRRGQAESAVYVAEAMEEMGAVGGQEILGALADA